MPPPLPPIGISRNSVGQVGTRAYKGLQQVQTFCQKVCSEHWEWGISGMNGWGPSHSSSSRSQAERAICWTDLYDRSMVFCNTRSRTKPNKNGQSFHCVGDMITRSITLQTSDHGTWLPKYFEDFSGLASYPLLLCCRTQPLLHLLPLVSCCRTKRNSFSYITS
jgi:hypothetical protein